MIIDFKTDPNHAMRYDVFDAHTGVNINHLRIFYADDQAGVIRCHSRNEAGCRHLDATGEVATEEHRRAILIREKTPWPRS